jgi:hypothetical protein
VIAQGERMEDEVLPDVRAISRSEQFRSIAQKWQARAEDAQGSAVKEQFLRLAEAWLQMSLFAEQHEQ